MELITLATDAITLSLPFLTKAGEKIAENIGQEVWNLLKRPFTSPQDKKLLTDLHLKENQDAFRDALVNKLSNDPIFEKELTTLVEQKQQQLINNAQQNVNNNAQIEKQINVQNNSGNIQM